MMEKTLFALSLGFAGVILATHAGRAAPSCTPRDQVVAVLTQTCGETRRGIGLNGSDQVIEDFANTRPDGITHPVAAGQPYEAARQPRPAKADPAKADPA